MNLLAIDTATPVCAIAVRTSSGVEVVRVLDEHRRHTEVLMPGVAGLLAQCGLVARDVDCVVVDRGPGLFTGLRVGVATANAFARALGVGIVTVTSLELLAHGAHESRVRGTLVGAVDARRGEVFVQTFHLGDEVEAVGPPEVARPRDIAIAWATSGAPVTFTGDGVERYLGDFAAVPQGAIAHATVPSLHAALDLGAARSREPEAVPLYLRDADAVANFTTRERP